MIKKLLIFVLLLVIGLFIGNYKQVKALEYNVYFSYTETNNSGSPYVIYSTTYFPIEPHTYVEIFIPRLAYLQDGMDGYISNDINYNSQIIFYNEFYGGAEQVNISANMESFRDVDGVYRIPTGFSQIHQPLSTPKYFRFELEIPYYVNILEYTTFLNDTFAYVFDDEIEFDGQYFIKYFANGREFLTIVDKTQPEIIPPDPISAGLYFVGWYDKLGVAYNFDRVLPLDIIGDNTITIYSGFSKNNPLVDPELDEPNIPDTIDYFLYIQGWNSAGAKILIFVIISVLLILGGIAIKLPTFTHVMVNMLIGGLFIFMQWLPLYIAIPLILIQIVILISTVKGGSN